MENTKRICLGAIVGVHGIRGEVKVKSFTERDADIDKYGPLESKDGSRIFDIRVTGRSKELLRVKIKGVDDRNASEALIGTELYVEKDVLPELAEDEYYHADLIGLDVIEKDSGRSLGNVSGIYNFGAGEILEIKMSGGGKLEMIPFTRQYVPDVRIKEGCIIVESAVMNFAEDDDGENASDEG